jgi:DNA-binding MarR family transcriptional regulator
MAIVKSPRAQDLRQFTADLEILIDQLSPARRPQDANDPECSLTELRALGALGRSRPVTMTDLAEAMNVTVSTATRTVDKLAAKGLATRRREAEDRREVRVTFSRKGEEIQKYIAQQRVTAARRILAAVAPSSRDAFVRAVARIARAGREGKKPSD